MGKDHLRPWMLHVEEEKALFPSSNTSSKGNVAESDSATDEPINKSSTNPNEQTDKPAPTHE